MKIEKWNGFDIRFVDKDGEWWAVLADICKALELKPKYVKERLNKGVVSTDLLNDANGRPHEYLLVSEKGIYKTIFKSRKPEAEAFQDWVMDVLVELRKQTGLEGFQVFRMLDKEHQKQAMQKIKQGMDPKGTANYIKANTIANKAVSTMYGHKKMLKKDEMTPEMLVSREPILDDTVELMVTKNKFGLDVSVSKVIYDKYQA